MDRPDLTRTLLRDAARRAGLDTLELSADPREAVGLEQPEHVYRAPGGYLTVLTQLGSTVSLFGATAEWFCGLGPDITGRSWRRVGPVEARGLVATSPHLVKLADAKHRAFPTRRYDRVEDLERALTAVGATDDTALLATDVWLPIQSEYRTFTRDRTVLTCSPYSIEDEPWSPLLHTHRASFHEQATEFVAEVLGGLPGQRRSREGRGAPSSTNDGLVDHDVPPTAVLDVARLDDGRFVVLEANQAWSSGLYGCDPDGALAAIVAANDATGRDPRWLWQPDTTLFHPATS